MVQVFVKEQEEEAFLLRYCGGSIQKQSSHEQLLKYSHFTH
jgi:hypothetical protein